jgi:hypothetical protein
MIDYVALRRTNPQLYRVIQLGKASAFLIPQTAELVKPLIKQFNLDKEQSEMLRYAIIGSIVDLGFKQLKNSL